MLNLKTKLQTFNSMAMTYLNKNGSMVSFLKYMVLRVIEN